MTDREFEERRDQPRAQDRQQQKPPAQRQGGRSQPRDRGGQHGSSGRGKGQGLRGPLLGEYSPPYVRRTSQVAAVMLYNNGGYSVLWPDHREDVNKPWVGRPYSIVEIQLGVHVTSFDLRLPAAGDAAFFDATARVHWEVVDPRLVVRRNLRDVGELLHDELLAGLRSVSRRFRLTESHRADEAVRAEVEAGRIALGQDLGLSTRVHVFIDLSDDVKTRVQEKDTLTIDMENDDVRAESERRKNARKHEAIRAEAKVLQEILSRGEESEIAYYMATNPDKQWEIRQAIREERREGQADFIGLFHKLLDTGNLERHDIGDHMYEVLQYLRENSGGVLGGVIDSVGLPLSGGSRHALEQNRNRNGRPGRDGDHGRQLERGDDEGRRERAEPRHPFWEEESTPGPDGEGRVYEPTRVDSSADQERERERERQRERGRDYGRDVDRDREADRRRDADRDWDGDRDRDRGWDGDRERPSVRDRHRDRDLGRDEDFGRGRGHGPEQDDLWGPDEYHVNSRSEARGSGADRLSHRSDSSRRDDGRRAGPPSAGFDDWDD
ncbi:hypothetical protein [Streptomyces sp. NPDC058657]|uniref:hypothetical protein n=1 Tax=unclassified Streptomyces TaxID=2593676 RepID=UPI0036564DE9